MLFLSLKNAFKALNILKLFIKLNQIIYSSSNTKILRKDYYHIYLPTVLRGFKNNTFSSVSQILFRTREKQSTYLRRKICFIFVFHSGVLLG